MQRTRKRRPRSRGNRFGFSLTEVLIVIAIILVIMAFAVPRMLRARESANEAAAAGALRTITVGQTTYQLLYHGYAPTLDALGPPKDGDPVSDLAADLIDLQLASGAKGGYRFRYTPRDLNGDGVIDAYLVTAEPESGDSRTFTVDESAVIKSQPRGGSSEKGKGGGVGTEPK